mgnify:CR=1 FL=1
MSRGEMGIPVRIMGEEFRVAGASPERVQALAEFVDRRFREVQAARPSLDARRLAVAVTLTIAEELFDERHQHRIRRGVEADSARRVRHCREALERVFQEAAWGAATEEPRNASG